MNIPTTIALSAIGGAIVGGAVTYLTVNKALRTRYEDWANSEIDSVKARYAKLNETGKADFISAAENPSEDMKEAVEIGKKILQEMGYSPEEVRVEGDTEAPHPSARTLSIFEQATDPSEVEEDEEDDEPLQDLYLKIEGEPFLVTKEVFFENEDDYELDTLTYYAVDDTLTDEKNTQIDSVDETIGVRHLHMFPTVSANEKNSIFIQNDKHQTIYEVIHVEESYAMNFLGMTEEELGLKEPKRRPGKMPKDHD